MRFQFLFGFINTNSQYLSHERKNALTKNQSRVCAARRCAKNDPICVDILLHELFHRKGISHRTCRTRAAVRHKVWLLPCSNGFIKSLLQGLVTKGTVFHSDNFCTEKLIKQKICRWLFRLLPRQHQCAVKAITSSSRGRLAAVIGLHRSARDQHVRTLLACFCDQKFQLTGLVPTKSQSRLVITLDEKTRSTKDFGKVRQFFNRCRQMSKVQSWDWHLCTSNDLLCFLFST